MSRIGKKIINIPEKVDIEISGDLIKVKGPKGNLNVAINPQMKVVKKENTLTIERPSESRTHRSLHGTTRQLIANAVYGVSEGFQKELEIRGVGYQANMDGKYLVLQLGLSHEIFFEPPENIEINNLTVEGTTRRSYLWIFRYLTGIVITAIGVMLFAGLL